MSLIITNKVFRIDGNTVTTELHTGDNQVKFLQYFETHGWELLQFKNESELIKKLDEIFKDETPMFITGSSSDHYGELWYQESIGDRSLKFFGYIDEV